MVLGFFGLPWLLYKKIHKSLASHYFQKPQTQLHNCVRYQNDPTRVEELMPTPAN